MDIDLAYLSQSDSEIVKETEEKKDSQPLGLCTCSKRKSCTYSKKKRKKKKKGHMYIIDVKPWRNI